MHALDQAWETLRREFDASCAHAARAARYQLTNELNQLLRRFRHYRNESEWTAALLDGASRFAQQVAIFSLQDEVLRLRGQSRLDLSSGLEFPLKSGAAFAAAAETRDPVVALRSASEVTEALAVSDPHQRAHLLPVMNGMRTVAVLFAADQEYIDLNALELIAGVASAVLERQSNAALHSQIAPVAQASPASEKEAASPLPSFRKNAAEPARQKQELPSWAALSEDQRAVHIRAQRFSRVAVAEMQLAKPEACQAGREQGNLYLFLKPEIDKARESYQKQFMTISSMVDYLHLELVRSAAENDEMKLGVEYPGQLV